VIGEGRREGRAGGFWRERRAGRETMVRAVGFGVSSDSGSSLVYALGLVGIED